MYMKNKKYTVLQKIQKRDGMIVPFDEKRITRAVRRAMQAANEGSDATAEKVMVSVLDALLMLRKEKNLKVIIPSVELIQDTVENELIQNLNQEIDLNVVQFHLANLFCEYDEYLLLIPENQAFLLTLSPLYW